MKSLLLIVFLINGINSAESDSLFAVDQNVRDRAAANARVNYKESDVNKWKEMGSHIKNGDVKKDVIKYFNLTEINSEGGMSSGSAHSDMLRLDNDWILILHIRNDNDEVFDWSISKKMKHCWVNPPNEFTGNWVTYFVNGNKSHEFEYKSGKRIGKTILYYDSGDVCVVQNQNENGAHGDDTGYYKSGKINYRGRYENGKMIGVWEWYDEDGKIINKKSN